LNEYSDNDLIMNYKQSSNTLFAGELYKRYTRFVFLISLKYLKNEDLSKDAVMAIFEKILTDLKKHEIENFKSWLHVVTKNFCLQELRKNKSLQKKHNDYENFSNLFMEKEEDLHHTFENESEKKLLMLEKALEGLNNEQKTCVKLFYLQEKSYKEITEITGFDVNKVKSFIQNGKRNLKISLQNSGYIILIFNCIENIFNLEIFIFT